MCTKIGPKMPFWYWLSTLFLGETTEECWILLLCNETILDCVYLREETNKDNYCQRILFILCAVCLWRINMLQPELVGLLGQSASSFMLFIIPCSTALSNSYYTTGLSDATASRTKHFRLETLCVWALGFNPKKKQKGWKEKRWERGREKEEKRDCSSGRVQIEFHINVCKFPRSCWLRLEKLISWMQRQYWCHQAERREEQRTVNSSLPGLNEE